MMSLFLMMYVGVGGSIDTVDKVVLNNLFFQSFMNKIVTLVC
jgi:hypothetical protein